MKDIKNAGFTMVEIIVTLVILAIVAAFTVPTLGGFIEDAHARDCKSKRTDLAKAYTTQLVDNGVASPGSTIDIMVMESVLEAKGATKDDGTAAAALGNEGEESNVVTYGEYLDLCPSGGVYSIKTKPSEDGTQSVLFLSCSQHGDVDVCEGADTLIVEGIQITKMPSKTIYNKGGAFTAAGGEIEVTFKDKNGKTTTKTINMTNAMCSQPNMQQTGSQSVTVSYGTKTASFTIEVKENIQLTGISITTPPTKTTYYWGESFNPTGMVVTAAYSDGTSAPVTGYTITAPTSLNMQEIEDKDIAVSYTEGDVTKTATWSKITVKLVQVRIVNSDGTTVKEYTDTVSGDGTALKEAIKAVNKDQTIQILVKDYQLNPDVQNNPVGGGDEGIGIEKAVNITTATDIVGGPARIYTTSKTASNLFQIKTDNAKLTLSDLVLDGGNTVENPSVSTCRVGYVANGTIIVENTTIRNFTLSKTNLFYGGAFALKTQGTLEISHTTIENCTINSNAGTEDKATYGGAIAAGGTASVVLGEGTVITGCSAQYGGALSTVTESSSKPSYSLSGVNISSCMASSRGAAIDMTSSSILTLTDTSITNCTSPTGAVYAGGASTTLGGNVQLTGSTTTGDEGQEPSACNLYLPGTKNLIIAEGGLADTASVGVSMETASRLDDSQEFAAATQENTQNVDKLYADSNSTIPEEKDKFYGIEIGNKKIVWRSVGFVPVCQLVHEGNKTLYGTIQSAVKDAVDGDTIEMLQDNYTVKSTIEFKNSVTLTKAETLVKATLVDDITDGNALFRMVANGKTVRIQGLHLINEQNNSQTLYQTSGTVNFEEVSMIGFKSGASNGGTIQTTNGTLSLTKCEIKNSSVTSNKAQGGAIYAEKSQVTITDSLIENCKVSGSEGSGGGIYTKDVGGKLVLKTTTIKDCSAVQYGGAITTFQSPTEITASTIDSSYCTQTSGPSGGGAIRAANSSDVKLIGTTISNCHAIQGGVLSSGASTVTIDGGTITGNYADGGVLMDCYGRDVNNGNSTLRLMGTLEITKNGKSEGDSTRSIFGNSNLDGKNPNTVLNMSDNVKITKNTLAGGAGYGIIGGGNTPNLMTISGNVMITGNTVSQGAGGVYVNTNGSTVLNLSGNVQITKNANGSAESRINSNVVLAEKQNLKVIDNLSSTASIGVTATNRMTDGQQFGIRSTTGIQVPEGCFNADTVGLYGVTEGTTLKWKNSIKSIEFKKNKEQYLYPKTVYNQGETFSTDGGKLTATYSDGTTKDVDLSETTCSGYDLFKVGGQTVVVTYKGVTTTYPILVQSIEPETDEAKKCILKLTNMLYGKDYGFWYWNACTFYNGFTHSGNRYNGAVISSKEGHTAGWFTNKCVYGNTNDVLKGAIGISDINPKYVWAIVPNSKEGGYDPNTGKSNADEYGYTIIWCESNGLTGTNAIRSGQRYPVLVYDTKEANYRNGTITAAQNSGNIYLDTATLEITE